MITGASFANGVFYHNHKVLACAEVKNGVIHTWGEPMTLRTLFKMWLRIFGGLPWYYNLLHAAMVLYLLFPVFGEIDPLWLIVYLIGFHFVFPRQLKMFHGAEHKVFSHAGIKKLDKQGLDEIARASIVNAGCSTNVVTSFFVLFLPALLFLPLWASILAGVSGIVLGMLGIKYAQEYMKPLYQLSGFLQKYVTTKEPKRVHLETAVRSYLMFLHVQTQVQATQTTT
nr:DUF1385 domain-containing protein [Brevibacillus dissolubilis]